MNKIVDEDDYEDEDDNFCNEKGCFFHATDCCQCCGVGLCHMHLELGCGFCRNCPSKEWIDEQKSMG